MESVLEQYANDQLLGNEFLKRRMELLPEIGMRHKQLMQANEIKRLHETYVKQERDFTAFIDKLKEKLPEVEEAFRKLEEFESKPEVKIPEDVEKTKDVVEVLRLYEEIQRLNRLVPAVENFIKTVDIDDAKYNATYGTNKGSHWLFVSDDGRIVRYNRGPKSLLNFAGPAHTEKSLSDKLNKTTWDGSQSVFSTDKAKGHLYWFGKDTTQQERATVIGLIRKNEIAKMTNKSLQSNKSIDDIIAANKGNEQLRSFIEEVRAGKHKKFK